VDSDGPIVDTWLDKSSWGDGPWNDEPDRIEWRSGEYVCLMLRNVRHGMWCGYVAVLPGHPWHGVEFGDIDADVHGGLTYSGHCMTDERPLRERVCHASHGDDDLWWVGFDCHHAFDFAPAFVARERDLASRLRARGDEDGARLFEETPWVQTYRHVVYVRDQVGHLVEQAMAAREEPPGT